MAQLVEKDPRVSNVGLCNFDTRRMNEIVEAGVKIVTNQVQVSYQTSSAKFEVFSDSSHEVLTRRLATYFQDGRELPQAQREAPDLRITRK